MVACPASEQCLWHTTNRFCYHYPEPVTRVLTRLRLLPRPCHGRQRVVRTHLSIDPHPRIARSWTDHFGNCVLEVEHAQIHDRLEVSTDCCFALRGFETRDGETGAADNLRETRSLFLSPTRLVDPTGEFEAIADELRDRWPQDEAFAWEAMHHVYREMRYLPGSTGVETAASLAFAQRSGVCQDYAHVMLALCRAAGLPARYVSGHLEGEGQMHAWVEVFYTPAGDGAPAWHPLDPTHDCAAVGPYVTVAVGRDYADVSPISGRCFGPSPGRLSSYQQTRCCLADLPSRPGRN